MCTICRQVYYIWYFVDYNELAVKDEICRVTTPSFGRAFRGLNMPNLEVRALNRFSSDSQG